MIIEDLLWRDSVDAMGLPTGERDTLVGADVLQECEVLDIRVCGVLSSVGVILDGRTGLLQVMPWAPLVDTVVLVVRGVTGFESPSIRDAVGSWEVVWDENSWTCRMGQFCTPGQVLISGCGVSLYFGRVPGLTDTPPLLGSSGYEVVRAGWPHWGSPFEVMIEPEHVHPHVIGGYVQRLVADYVEVGG